MQLMRRQETWDPFRDLETLSSRINQLFAKWPGNGEGELLATTDWTPSCNISETEKEYRVHAELPGVNKDGVHVTLEDGILTIQGERREEKEDKNAKVHRRELSYGNFMRRFTMPPDTDEAKVDAVFKDGILNVTIPKTKTKAPSVKEIAVH